MLNRVFLHFQFRLDVLALTYSDGRTCRIRLVALLKVRCSACYSQNNRMYDVN